MSPATDSSRPALAQSLVVGLPGPGLRSEDLALVSEQGVGGIILFSRNIESPRQVWQMNRDLQRAAAAAGRPPLFIMVDQEGGSVARLKGPFTHEPDMSDLAGADTRALAAHGARMGAELAAAGFNWDLAPVLDVHARPDGVMARRSLGPNPERVAELGAAFISGMQGAGCLACAKHFPGLGRTTLDTHKDRPRVDLAPEELAQIELPPFRAAVTAQVAGVMVCHAVFSRLDSERPASLSAKVIDGLLRRDLGFDGLVLSDDLEMGAVVSDMSVPEAVVGAYGAGCDLLLVCAHAEYAVEALDRLEAMALSGELDTARIEASAERIALAKARLKPEPPVYAHLAKVLSLDA